jgi:hypothetical protein
MKYQSVIRGLVTGTYALFSARINKHIASCTLVEVYCGDHKVCCTGSTDDEIAKCIDPGTIIHRHYKCESSGSMVKAFSLHKWNHLQTISIISDHKAHVIDELEWYTGSMPPHCFATREYTLIKNASNKIVRKDSAWNLDCTKPPLTLSTVKSKIKSSLKLADIRSFENFIQQNDSDESDDESNLRNDLDYLMRNMFD